MSGTPRTRPPRERQRPRMARIVLGTVFISAAVVIAGYVTGLFIGQVLL